MPSLAEIRAKLAAQENKPKTTQSPSGDNAVYSHWNMPTDTTATIRFLPDGDTKNTYFWVERQLIKLPFNGVVGNNDVRRIDVSVPCVEMYDPKAQCPILSEVRNWYKDESMKELANKYWKKRSYIFQGFVRANPWADDKTPENPIRRFIISPQIFQIIKSSLMDPELDEMPTDSVHGLDFHIKKTKKGDYADYSTSVWSRKTSALTDVEREAIDQYGLFNLAEFLPGRPGDAELRVLAEMFEASVDNQPYDPARWSGFYRPWGMDAEGKVTRERGVPVSDEVVEARPRVTVPVSYTPQEVEKSPPAVQAEAPPPQPAKPATSDKTQDILALIRSRQTAKQ